MAAQHPVPGREKKRQQELQGLNQNDAASGGAVAPVADEDTENAGEHTAENRQQRHSIEAIGEQIGRGPWSHKHGNHKNDAHGLKPYTLGISLGSCIWKLVNTSPRYTCCANSFRNCFDLEGRFFLLFLLTLYSFISSFFISSILFFIFVYSF